MHDKSRRGRPGPLAQHGAEVLCAPNPPTHGQHGRLVVTRPRGACDPCRGARPECHVQRGCSSGSGTRACGHADGCSAGTCASWRHPCGWVISGEEPSPMGTTGRTDLFLVTKVRNALSTGQTHLAHPAVDHASTGPPAHRRVLARLPRRPVVRGTPNLWKTLARCQRSGLGSPASPAVRIVRCEHTAWEVGLTGG